MEWALHSTRLCGDVVDVSMSGAAIVIDGSTSAGEDLMFRIQNRVLGSSCDVQGRVLRADPTTDGRNKIICEFSRRLTLEQVRKLGCEPFESSLV